MPRDYSLLVTSEQMRVLDRQAIERYGVDSLLLMENAGRALAEQIMLLSDLERWGKRWTVLAGKGSNGGDGLVAARHLHAAGWTVRVIYSEDPESLQGDTALHHETIKLLGIPYRYMKGAELDNGHGSLAEGAAVDAAQAEGAAQVAGVREVERMNEASCEGEAWLRELPDGWIDAMLGTGSHGQPRGAIAAMIRAAVDSGRPIVAADIPSGVDADNGQVHEPYIRAVCTVTFGARKRGLTQDPAHSAAGHIHVAPLGAPMHTAQMQGYGRLLCPSELAASWRGPEQLRRSHGASHKGSYGKLALIAGSSSMLGAGLLTGQAALRSGAGLVQAMLPAALLPQAAGRIPELMLTALGKSDSVTDWGAISAAEVMAAVRQKGASAIAIGPGLGRFAGDEEWISAIWDELDLPMVVDADALNMLAAAGIMNIAEFGRTALTVITPYPGEMARLMNVSVGEIQADRFEYALALAKELQVTVVLKGAGTIVAAADGRFAVNESGNAGMATGGSGDILTGMISALLAQGYDSYAAACLAVYVHGYAGNQVAELKGMTAMLPSDVITAIDWRILDYV